MDSVNKQPGAQLEKVEESDKDQLAVLDSADEQPKAQRHRLEKVVGEERLIVLCDFLSIIIRRVRSSKLVQRLRAKSETTQVA